MLLVFRLFRNYVTKNPIHLYNLIKSDRNDVLNYLKNLTAFYTSNATITQTSNLVKNTQFNFLQKYQIQIKIFDYSDTNKSTCETKINETSLCDSMGNNFTRKRHRRSKLHLKKVVKVKKKRLPKRKIMNNFYFNNPAGFQVPYQWDLSTPNQPFIPPHPNYQFSRFPPLNPNFVFNSMQPLITPNPPIQTVSNSMFTQHLETTNTIEISRNRAKTYSDVVKSENLVRFEGTNLEQFLAEIRHEIYTPYGEWLRKGGNENAPHGVNIKILSYNILAQNLLEMHPHLYVHHDKKYLDWEYRKKALLKEFEKFDADVLCLQEVEGKETEFFDMNLESLGYKGIYKKRTNEKEDGCAIYYRVEKFDLKEFATVEYFQPNIQLLNRDNIALIARLSPKRSPNSSVVVANTHLLFNPNRHDIKLAQAQMLLAEIDRIAFKSEYNRRGSPYHPIVIVGDFNLKPHSYVYKLLVNGYLEDIRSSFRGRRNYGNPNELMPIHLGITDGCQHYDVVKNRMKTRTAISDFKYVRLHNSDRKSLSFNEQQTESKRENPNYRLFGSGCLYHNLSLSSAYPHDHLSPQNATTFQDDWCNVDYIFYGPRRQANRTKVDDELKLVSYMGLPNTQEAEILRCIPNKACASDHLPLMATFHLPI